VLTPVSCQLESARVRGAFIRGPREKARFTFGPRVISLETERVIHVRPSTQNSIPQREIDKRREEFLSAFSANWCVGLFRCRLVQLPERALRELEKGESRAYSYGSCGDASSYAEFASSPFVVSNPSRGPSETPRARARCKFPGQVVQTLENSTKELRGARARARSLDLDIGVCSPPGDLAGGLDQMTGK
jgi:hypothetical protein